MSRWISCRVPQSMDGKTVRDAAVSLLHLSASQLKSMKRTGGMLRGGCPCRSVDTICAGDILSFDIADPLPSEIAPQDLPLTVVYEDEDLLLLDKSGGMSMHPSVTEHAGTVANALAARLARRGETGRFHAVNRLDKDTSGLCLIAKNRYTHARLSEQIRDGTLHKRYYAIVHGAMPRRSGRIALPIARAQDSILRRTVSPAGKAAITQYRTVLENGRCALLEVTPQTGRTHQIRVHLAALGHPLLGDWLYGNGDAEKALIGRQALHAHFILFRHPVSGQIFSFHAPLPHDMRALLTRPS